MVIDERVGWAELEQLAERLAPPCQVGEYVLEGLIRKTSTALIFVGRGGAFGSNEGVLKLTGQQYAPLLDRELDFLNRCHDADIRGVVRPVRRELEWIHLHDELQGVHGANDELRSVHGAAILLPFLSGGDLVQWIGTRTGLGPCPALQIAELVGSALRSLLRLPRPLVHGDVKPQNVLLPHPGATLSDLTIIDLDATHELEVDIDNLADASRDVLQPLVDDVNAFGELLYVLSTGGEAPVDREPKPETDNPPFNTLVLRCLSSEPEGSDYASLADVSLWRDLEAAQAFERDRKPPNPVQRLVLKREFLAVVGLVLFAALVAAIAAKFVLT
jgi:serine/threonine protein kinase